MKKRRRGDGEVERECGGHSVTPDLLILTFITYTHSVPRVLGTKGSHWEVVGRETELGNWGRGEAGWALKVQGRVVWPSQDRGIWAAATLPLRSLAWPPPQSYWPLGTPALGLSSPKPLSLSSVPPLSVPVLVSLRPPLCVCVSLSLPCFVSSLS